MPKVNLDDFTIVSYDILSGFDSNGDLLFEAEELTDVTISNAEETTDITGKLGRILMRLKRNKSTTVSGTNGLLVGGLLATQVGDEINKGTYNVRYRDVITVNSDTAVTTYKAEGAAGAEIEAVYVRVDGASTNIIDCKKLTQVAETPATGQFQYTPDSKTLTFFADDIEDGTQILVYYDVAVDGYSIANRSDQYSDTVECTLDVTCQDTCNNRFHGQFLFRRADFSGAFDLTGGTDPTTHPFEFTTLPDVCNENDDLWDFYIFGEYATE